MFNLSYGLFVLTANSYGKDNGCVINTATQVTTSPNTITIAVNKDNLTHDMIKESGKFNLSILSEDVSFSTIKSFGFQSGRDNDKLIEIEYARSKNGITYLTMGVNGYISGKVINTLDLGSHTLFIASVEDGDILGDKPSATYSYYQNNIKPNVNTGANKKGFICTVCGYIYEAESLEEDFICPICKHPAQDFKAL